MHGCNVPRHSTNSASSEDPAGSLVARIGTNQALLDSFDTVRRSRGAAGVDRITIAEYITHSNTNLTRLRTALVQRRYRPKPLRRILIPKGSGDFRTLAIPTVEDRIVQLAAAREIVRIVGPTFSSASFAYRAKRGPLQAANRLAEIMAPGSWAVISDIEQFFDNIDHETLAQLLLQTGVDREGVSLITAWARCPVLDRGFKLQPIKGIPQGSPISPVLANLYLTGLDRLLEHHGWPHVRYADDFVVIADTEAQAVEVTSTVGKWLRVERKLRLKASKQAVVPSETGIEFVGFMHAPRRRWLNSHRLESFQSRVETIFSEPSVGTVAETVKAHNDLVRGWRAYYLGSSDEIDKQLSALEAWRAKRATEYWSALQQTAELIGVVFQQLIRAPPPPGTPIGYGSESAGRERLDLPQIDADPWHTRVPDLAGTRDVFSSQQELKNEQLTERLQPTLLADGLLDIHPHGSFFGLRGGAFFVRHKANVSFECGPEEVQQVVVSGSGVGLSSKALLACAESGIPVVLCDSLGAPAARLVPVRSDRHPDWLRQQLAATRGRAGKVVAVELIHAKLHNQRALLLYHAKYDKRELKLRNRLRIAAKAIAEIAGRCDAILSAADNQWTHRLFLLEAHAAGHYWSAIAALVPAALGFPGRRHRGACDPVNILLNYGYWLLGLQVWRALELARLQPYLGVLHSSRKGGPGLVFDAIEPFRQPLVDRAVLAMIGRGTRIIIRKDGRLSVASRKRAQIAFDNVLRRRVRRTARHELAREIRLGASNLRAALEDQQPLHAYRMPW